MIRAVLHSADRFVEHAGGLSILALDGILLIPLAFAAFFFPLAVLGAVVVVALLSAIVFAVTRSHHHRHGMT